jgi:hypothetical protein
MSQTNEETKSEATVRTPPPGPPISSKASTKNKFIVNLEENDFKSILESKKNFINTSSNYATSTTEVKTTILPKSKIKLTVCEIKKLNLRLFMVI